jgi:lipopolysaccharide biosynthesis glycosyltransferase
MTKSPDRRRLRLACSSTREYSAHSAAMIHSVLEHSGSLDVDITYLHGPTYPDRTAELIRAMVERAGGTISFLRVADDRVTGLRTTGQFPRPMWYRMFLPELLPEVDKILYLDIDTIAVDSLESLWDIDIADHYLAAVTNVFEPHFAHRPAELGLELDAYFNSGVVLMNLDRMRRDSVPDALVACALERGEQLLWVDQDALNIVLGGNRLPLHPRWNCMNSVLNFPWSAAVFGAEAVAEARRHPGIRHFEGPATNKPWHYLCDHEGRELYFHHRRSTPWPRYRLEGLTARNVIRRLGRRLPSGRVA